MKPQSECRTQVLGEHKFDWSAFPSGKSPPNGQLTSVVADGAQLVAAGFRGRWRATSAPGRTGADRLSSGPFSANSRRNGESALMGTGPQPARRPTLEQVAEVAGVSRATVSRVVNGVESVDPDIRGLVERAIAETGYVPNRAARSL